MEEKRTHRKPDQSDAGFIVDALDNLSANIGKYLYSINVSLKVIATPADDLDLQARLDALTADLKTSSDALQAAVDSAPK